PMVLGDHLDQRWGRIRIRLDVEVAGRVDTDGNQTQGPQQDDKAVVQAPRDEGAYHERSLDPCWGRREGMVPEDWREQCLQLSTGGISWRTMERKGLEPSTSALRTRRSPS